MKRMNEFSYRILFILVFLLNVPFLVKAEGGVEGIRIESTTDGKKLSVVMKEVTQTAHIRIQDELENILIEKTVRKATQFAKLFNVEKLQEGSYQIIIAYGFKEIIQPFMITPGGIILEANQLTEFFNPVLKLDGNTVDLCLLNNNLTPVQIEITSPKGEILFSESFVGALQIHRRYNLKKFSPETYVVKVTTPYRDYYEQISL